MNRPLILSNAHVLDRRIWTKKNLSQERTEKSGTEAEPLRPRGILDVSYSRLWDRPVLLEEKLLKMPGVVSAEINAFSKRIRVEFDPSQTTLDKIKKIIATRKGS